MRPLLATRGLTMPLGRHYRSGTFFSFRPSTHFERGLGFGGDG